MTPLPSRHGAFNRYVLDERDALLQALQDLPLACPHRPTCPELGAYRCCWCLARETLERVG